MNEWEILHQVMLKMVIGYPLLIGIIGFCIFEAKLESIIRKEKRNEQC